MTISNTQNVMDYMKRKENTGGNFLILHLIFTNSRSRLVIKIQTKDKKTTNKWPGVH